MIGANEISSREEEKNEGGWKREVTRRFSKE